MFGKAKRSIVGLTEEEDPGIYLNVTPMIDVLTCLLFFLLLSFGAVIIALINTTIPVLSESSAQAEPDKKITVTLVISEKGYSLTAQNDIMTEDESNKLKRSFALASGDYDFTSLNNYLFELKQRYKDSENIVLLPDADVPYEKLIKTMDVTREREGQDAAGKPIRIPLFPAAVISSLVK
jgi:biopolymer transport protein ExbD